MSLVLPDANCSWRKQEQDAELALVRQLLLNVSRFDVAK